MFRIDHRTLQAHLSGDGGGPFTHFVDELIQLEAFMAGMPMDRFHRQLRVNIGDGGVDTSLEIPILDSSVGWFDAPTCWQYKAESTYDLKSLVPEIKREMRKSHATKLIQEGYAYRFCMLADIPDDKTQKVETEMLSVATEIWNKTGGSPKRPRLVDGADLQNWIELRPTAVLSLTGQTGEFLSLRSWVANTRDLTPDYVSSPAAAGMFERIRAHVNLQQTVSGSDVCLTISGLSGVGKTRFVAEALDSIEGAHALVVQTANDQQARELAARAAEDPRATLVLVADECSPASVRSLQGLAAASSDRIRIIAIEHFERLTSGGASQQETWLDKLPPETTNAILRTNFPEVPDETRKRIVVLSDGYIRFAALICRNASGLNLTDLTQTIHSVSQWVDHYLDDDVDCDLVGAIALFSRVGFRDEFRCELESLTELTSIPIREIERRVERIRNRTGFVTQQGQFWYVTPELIAPEMFRRGWKAFAENDLDGFVKRLPPAMLEQFKRRVEYYGGEEVAAQVAGYFRSVMDRLSIDDLFNADIVEFVVSIAKLDPSRHVRRVADLLESCSDEDIGRIGTSVGSGSWGPRRHLVWMFEKMALFPEFFRDAERSLFKLARYETEEHIGNNATKVWATLWQIHFSNTPLPFDKRLAVLRERFEDSISVEFCELAVDAMIGRTGGGPVPPPFYAGRSVPDVWSPESRDNERQCLRTAIHLSAELMKHKPQFSETILDVLLRNLLWLVDRDVVAVLKDSLSGLDLSSSQRLRIYNTLIENDRRYFSHADFEGTESVRVARDWIDSLRPTNFEEQLRSVCSSDIWGERFLPENEGKPGEINELVQFAVDNPDKLKASLGWLSTDEAIAARRFGVKLGQADTDLVFADAIVNSLTPDSSQEFVAGYLSSLVKHNSSLPTSLRDFVGNEFASSPRHAMGLVEVVGNKMDMFPKILAAIENDDLSSVDVVRLAYNFGGHPLPSEQSLQLLESIANDEARFDREANWTVRLIHHLIMANRHGETEQNIVASPEFRTVCRETLRRAVPQLDRHSVGEWCKIATKLIQAGDLECFELFEKALGAKYLTLCRKSLDSLEELAESYPVEVMDCFGSTLIGESGLYLRVHVCDSLLDALPKRVVLDWCDGKSAKELKMIARHMPPPYQGGTSMTVPELLDEFLRAHGTDEILAELHAGKNSSGVWNGPLSPQLRDEAERLVSLMEHPNRWIQRYAVLEREYLLDWAEREQLREANEAIEHRTK
ncbi:ATP-binding protein [Roseiconus nitratireducens]|uniref:ATP-binding protein n=1 Tax=Roseiconus nitratireducens TaxID=2605748 RepID=A0A5M6CX15_9BACT|nr:ATP-binding protein [Roseiconus nitratireducens]KAA5539777.1 ATP-binding protein [Roseiconus nitratireducens]